MADAEKLSEELICIPCGGLNDSLATIGSCFNFCLAREKNLKLTICDHFSDGLMGQLANIFDFCSYTFQDSRSRLKRIARIRNKLSCPEVNCVSSKTLFESIRKSRLNDSITSNSPTIPEGFENLRKWMTENSLNWGSKQPITSAREIFVGYKGGPPSKELLRSIALKQNGRLIMESFNKHLPVNYNAAHIRNTDMKTDFKSTFIAAGNNWNDELPIMICSDDESMQAKAINFFGANRIIDRNKLMNKLLPFRSKPKYQNSDRTHDPIIHESENDRQTFVLRSVVDLFLLAQSKKLFFSKVNQSYSSISSEPATSGFSLLADMLKKDPSLMNRNKLLKY